MKNSLSSRKFLAKIEMCVDQIDNGNILELCFKLQSFTAPSFDDKILEVVAVFGSIQMAMSRVMNLQHHRIAQVI
jgi:hypothetical protein